MRAALLDLIVCPDCHGALAAAEVYASASPDHGSDAEILEATLRCTGCGNIFPVIAGVPRLLRPPLLRKMAGRYPAFFQAHPEHAATAEGGGHELADTLESFTRQRLD